MNKNSVFRPLSSYTFMKENVNTIEVHVVEDAEHTCKVSMVISRLHDMTSPSYPPCPSVLDLLPALA
jgi:hypothetical protein